MYIYNVTVNVEEDTHDEWLQWMKDVHIPDVMATGFFVRNRILEVMAEGDHGRTYSVQYEVKDMERLRRYQEEHSLRLQEDFKEKFGDKCVSFRTILRLEHTFQPHEE